MVSSTKSSALPSRFAPKGPNLIPIGWVSVFSATAAFSRSCASRSPKFAVKFEREFSSGNVQAGCLLLAVHRMTTQWFEALAALGPIVCLPNKRLKFSGVTAQPMHGSVILGFGIQFEAFKQEFSGFGSILSFL
jgi:hypothetical protein